MVFALIALKSFMLKKFLNTQYLLTLHCNGAETHAELEEVARHNKEYIFVLSLSTLCF